MERVLRCLLSRWEESMGTQVKTFPRTVAGTRVECGFGPTRVQSYLEASIFLKDGNWWRLAVCQALC